MDRRRFLLTSLAGALPLALSACALQETPFVVDDPEADLPVACLESGKTVRIGALFAFDSRASLTENNTLRGIELAVRDANVAGGIGARPLEVVKLSFDGSAASAEAAAKRAVGLGLVAVLGPSWSNPALKAAAVLNEAGVPMIVTLATHPDVTRERPYVFRAVGDDVALTRALATFVYRGLGARSWATFIDVDDESSVSAATSLATRLRRMGAIEARRIEYRSSASDADVAKSWSALLSESAPPVVFLPTKVRDTARIMRLGRSRGFKGSFVGGDGWGNRELMIIAGQSARGAYFVTHWNPDLDLAASVDFLGRYLTLHQVEPTVGAAVGYDAARALITALQEPGGTDRARLRDFLAAGSFSSTTGQLRFDAQRTAVRPIVVLKVGVARFDLHDVVQPDKARTATP